LFAHDRCLFVAIDVPDIYIPFCIAGCEHAWMLRAPLDVIYVFLRALKCEERLWCLFRVPQINGPVHRPREDKLSHVCAPLILADTRMHVNWSHRGIMADEAWDDWVAGLSWKHALVDVEVFGANVELFALTLNEVNAVSIYHLLVLRSLGTSHAWKIGALLEHRATGSC
jgi:hypothetical protein